MHSTPDRSIWLRTRELLDSDTRGGRPGTSALRGLERRSGARTNISRLRELMAKRSTAWAVVALGVLLCAPAVLVGRLLDDNFQAVALRDDVASIGSKRAAWDAFAFAKSPEVNFRMIEEGVFPWWSDLHAKLSFLRPLTSLSLWLDAHLWPHAPAMMHVHNLLWYGLLLCVIAGLYRRFAAQSWSLGFPGLALLLYAIDDAHAMSVGWIANRGALIGLTFGFAALLVHDRWRTRGQSRDLAGALTLLGVGLLSAEAAIQSAGYLIAYAIFLDTGTRRERWRSLIPYALLIAGWRVGCTLLGYGVVGSRLYIDPLRSPLAFAEAALHRLPVLLAAQLAGISADLGPSLKYLAPEAAGLMLPLSLAAIAACAWVLYPMWSSRREVRFWTVGMVLSTIPVCATDSSDRLLVATGLGGSALVAIVILGLIDRASELRPRSKAFFAFSMAAANLVVAPLLLPVQAYALAYMDRYIDHAERSIPSGADVANKTVVLLNVPSDEYGISLMHHRLLRGGVVPEHLRWLATADNDLHLERVDERSLEVVPSRGFLPPGSQWTLRSPDNPFKVGESLQLQGTRFTVTDVTEDGRAAAVLVQFDRPLDSDALVWLQWDEHGGFKRFELPQIGDSLDVPAMKPESVLGYMQD